MVQIREYRPTDLDRVYEIAMKSFDEFYDPSVFDYFRAQWPSGQLVACDIHDVPIGFLTATKMSGRRVRIMMLGVIPEFRNKGTGQMLLDRFRMTSLLEGNVTIVLEVRMTNTDARRFYRRNGFIETDILRDYYRDGGDGVHMIAPVQKNQ